jgi:hypothetical protein
MGLESIGFAVGDLDREGFGFHIHIVAIFF